MMSKVYVPLSRRKLVAVINICSLSALDCHIDLASQANDIHKDVELFRNES
jgi:hypothetical protein